MTKNKSIPIPDTPECLASHLGAWAIFPPVFQAHVAAFNNGQLKAMSREQMARANNSKELYNSFVQDNIQVISIAGVMQKKDSKFGGTTSTIKLRKSIRAAAADENIDGVMLHINSPGGTVSGISDLSSELKKLSAKKPVWTFVDEGAYSAGYWAAVHGSKIYANDTAAVGSVGVIAALIDSSKAAKAAGLEVVTITSGELKDFGYPGIEVGKKGIAVEQRVIDHYFSMFKDVVMSGRKMSEADFAKIADASWYVAPDAVKLKMIDAIADWDTAFSEFSAFLAGNANPSNIPDPAGNEDNPDIEDAEKSPADTPQLKINNPQPATLNTQHATKTTLKKGDNLMSADQLKETAAVFTEAFGAKAGEYMAAGLDFQAAAVKHLAAQSQEMEKLKADNIQLKSDLASEKAARETSDAALESLKSTAPPAPAASVPGENQESPEAKATREAAEAAAQNTFLGKVGAYKTEHKCDDLVAMTAISGSHPDLYQAHLAIQASPKK